MPLRTILSKLLSSKVSIVEFKKKEIYFFFFSKVSFEEFDGVPLINWQFKEINIKREIIKYICFLISIYLIKFKIIYFKVE